MTEVHWSAAARLLDRALPQGYLAESTDLVAAQKHAAEPGTKSAVIFRLGPEWLSLPTSIFQEVTEGRMVHKLPHRTGGVLRGLVNVRGELLLCAALGALLGLAESSEANEGNNRATREQLMVCHRSGEKAAFFVSEVYGLHSFHPSDVRSVPATVAKAAATYTAGLLNWKDRTVGCLDDELIFYALNKAFA